MIRRGFWLALGAAAGVALYRRAGRLARAVLPGRRPAGRPPAGRAATFWRDVRDGMDEYLARRPGGRAPTLDGQHPGIDYPKDGR